MVLGSGSMSNPACFRRLRTNFRALHQRGRAPAVHDSAFARLKFGRRWVETSHQAAGAHFAIAGKMRILATLLAEENVPALLSKDALETLLAPFDFSGKSLRRAELGPEVPAHVWRGLNVAKTACSLPRLAELPHVGPLDGRRRRWANSCFQSFGLRTLRKRNGARKWDGGALD